MKDCMQLYAWQDAHDFQTGYCTEPSTICRFGGGIPCKQYRLIYKDGLRISEYAARTFDGVARNSHLATDNYFYYSCLTGRFTKSNCPSYLKEENFEALKAGAIDNLNIVTSTFMEQLSSRTFTKV